MSCGRSQKWLRSELLWLCYRPVAEAPVQPLAWEIPYVAGVALKRQKTKKKKKKKKKKKEKKKKKKKKKKKDTRKKYKDKTFT